MMKTITCSILGCKCIIQLANLFLCREVIPREQCGAGAGPHSNALPPARARQRDSQALSLPCQVPPILLWAANQAANCGDN